MLVWVASYPRSGNTLVLTVLRDVYGTTRLGTALQEDRLGLELRPPDLPPGSGASAEPFRLPPELAGLANPELVEALRELPETFFIKTHRLAESADEAPAVYIVRDGRDALVSYSHYVAEHDVARYRGLSFENRLARLIRGGRGHPYGSWSENVATWTARSAPTIVIRFEELIADPVQVVTDAMRALGIDLPRPVGRLASFEQLRARRPRIFRRGEIGGWRQEMPPGLQRRFAQVHGDQMRALGYPVD